MPLPAALLARLQKRGLVPEKEEKPGFIMPYFRVFIVFYTLFFLKINAPTSNPIMA